LLPIRGNLLQGCHDVRFVSKGDIVEHFVSAGGAIPEENGLGRLGPKIFRDLRGKQLAPAAPADVTLDKFDAFGGWKMQPSQRWSPFGVP
jgi:hypothetical protein